MAWSPSCKPMNILQQGAKTFPVVSEWNDATPLPANTVVTYNLAAMRTAAGLPANDPLFCIFGADVPFWFHPHAVASIPAGPVTDGSASQYSPNQVYLDASVTTLSFIAPTAGHLSLSLYRS